MPIGFEEKKEYKKLTLSTSSVWIVVNMEPAWRIKSAYKGLPENWTVLEAITNCI